MGRVLRLWVLVAALVVPARTVTAQTQWWDRAWSCRRTVEAIPPRVSHPGSDAAYFELYGQGHLRGDAGDIRVVAGGQVLRHKLLHVSPTGIARILFQLLPNVTMYEVYYGNPEAPAAEGGWEPQRGLILQTRKYAGGRYNNWAQTQETLRRSAPVFGAGPVDRVFHGHNPFGPSDQFVSVYEGWLNCPVAGTYSFATTSGNASFLFVDDEPVVEWPGHHGPVADARRHREVVLAQGLHKFRYVAVFVGGRPTSVAAWKVPGSSRYEVIPKSAFPPVVTAYPKRLEVLGQRVAPDFRVEFAGEATLTPDARRYLVKVKFVNTSPGSVIRSYRGLWDFGDGITTQGTDATHIYAAPGTYTVTLSLLGSGRFQASQAIEVEQDWEAQVARRIDDRVDYYDELRRYDLTKLSGDALANLTDYFLAVEKPGDALGAGEELLLRRDSEPDRLLLVVVHRLGEVLVPRDYDPGVGREPDRALRLFAATEGKCSDARAKAEMALAQGDVLFGEKRELEQARSAYEKVTGLYRRAANSPEARRAYVGLGNLERWQGNLASARQWYEKAQTIPVGEESTEKLIVQRSAWARAVEDALNRSDREVTALAWEALVTWAWQYPRDLLAGHHTLLLAQLLLKEQQPQRAADELEALLRANPDGQYADQALWTLADCYLALADRSRALAALDRLQRGYPASGLIPSLDERRREFETAPLR